MPNLTQSEAKPLSSVMKTDAGKIIDAIYVDQEFRNRLISHIIGNYAMKGVFPCMLGIQGPMGEGKTVQTLKICKNMEVNIEYLAGCELSGSDEGDSREKLTEIYNKCCGEYKKNNYSVIIIDDLHESIASYDDDKTYTVNSQLLTGELMRLADKARIESSISIPIILIANNFKNLRLPLIRDGRIDIYSWHPTFERKREIVQNILRPILSDLDLKLLDSLFLKFPDEPISFFAELKHDLIKERTNAFLDENHIETIDKITVEQLGRYISLNDITSLAHLEDLAVERKKSSRAKNYLTGGEEK